CAFDRRANGGVVGADGVVDEGISRCDPAADRDSGNSYGVGATDHGRGGRRRAISPPLRGTVPGAASVRDEMRAPERTIAADARKETPYMRRILCQAAQAAVRTKNSIFEQKFRRLPRLGYCKAIWAIAWHLS